MIRVLVEAASPVARAGLEALLRGSPNLEVVSGEVSEADVIVADLRSTGEAAQELLDQSPGAAILLLADDPSHAWTAEVLRAGARGVLPREASSAQIVAAVEAVAAGLAVVPAEDLESLLAAPKIVRTAEPLSARELEALGMLAEGLSNKAIAYRMGISEHTVKFHVTSIMTKLNAGSRTEAVTMGIRQGLIML